MHEPDNERNLAEQLASTNMERHRRIGVMFSSELDVEGGDLNHFLRLNKKNHCQHGLKLEAQTGAPNVSFFARGHLTMFSRSKC